MQRSTYLHFAVNELLHINESQLMQPTVYDTSWMARLTHRDGSLAYPETLQWLLDRQHPDGSWGSQIPYIHDRLLSTLAVVILLAKVGNRHQDHIQRKAGERYIWQHVGKLHYDPHATIGFEMIMPTLLKEALTAGANIPYGQLRHYEIERAAKLALLPMNKLLAQPTTALFSLEAFAGMFDFHQTSVQHLILANGSLAVSPSATAFLLDQTPDWATVYPQSVSYLQNLLKSHHGGLPHVAPYDIFLRSWVLSNLHYGQQIEAHLDFVQPHNEYLFAQWQPDGVGYSGLEKVRDSDDTALTLLALRRAGYPLEGSCLLAYERPEHFACFDYERDPSISANLHILEALETLPHQDRARAQEKIINYVLSMRKFNAFWSDKWHASPYYPTSIAVIILSKFIPDEILGTISWFLNTQHTDGGWGQYGSTSEETALAIMALLHYHREITAIPVEPVKRAVEYLLKQEQPFTKHYPELWIGKVLYAPVPVIRSAILAALGLYQATFPDHL